MLKRGPCREVEAALGRLFGELVELGAAEDAARDERRLQALVDRLARDHALRDVLARRQLEHDVEERRLDDRAQAASTGLALERLVRDLREGVVREHELDPVVAEEALVLLDERVLRLGQDADEV